MTPAPPPRPARDIVELIRRLETATEDKGLSWDIAQAIGWSKMWCGQTIYLPPGETEADYDAGNAPGACSQFPQFATSIDAALSLVPEGWWAEIFARPDQPSCILWEFHMPCRRVPAERPYAHAGASVPLALCSAALRARQGARDDL